MTDRIKAREQAKLERALENNISEFLSCFLLVGYDVDGNEVVCRVVESDKDRDSLLMAVTSLSEKLNDAYFGDGEAVRAEGEDD